MSDIDTHPWASAQDHFNVSVMPKLKEHGIKIGKAADQGNASAKKIIQSYEMLRRSFDPVTLIVLEEALTEYLTP